MPNLVHFQMLHTSYSISSWLKCSNAVHSSEVIPKHLFKQSKCHLLCTWLSNSLYMRLNFTFTNGPYLHYKQEQQWLFMSNCLFTEIRVGYFSCDSFSSILSPLSVMYQEASHLMWALRVRHIDNYKTETQWGRWLTCFS